MAKFSLKKSMFNDRFVFVLSLILAIILWLFVSISFSPTVTKDISNIPVSIELENTEYEGLKLFGNDSYSVQIKVQGKKYITDSVSADDIKVTANIGQMVSIGANSFELSTEIVGSEDFEIVSVFPSKIDVFLDYEETKTFTLEAESIGAETTQENFFLEASVSDAFKSVTVRGAKSEIQNISRAVAVASVNEKLSATKVYKGQVKFYNEQGEEVSLKYSSSSFETADVTLGVAERITLPLTITPVNAPANLPEIKIYRILNEVPTLVNEIEVKRDPNLVGTLNEISIGKVDFATIDVSQKEWVIDNLFLPSIGGVSYPTVSSTSETAFRVVISFNKLVTKNFDLEKSSIKIGGLSADKSAVIQTNTLQGVTVVSTNASELKKLKSSEITAIVDVSSLDKGSHSCNKVSFTIKDHPNCWVVIPKGSSFDVAVKIE